MNMSIIAQAYWLRTILVDFLYAGADKLRLTLELGIAGIVRIHLWAEIIDNEWKQKNDSSSLTDFRAWTKLHQLTWVFAVDGQCQKKRRVG